MHLSFKSVCNKEHKGVICNMTYKVPYITTNIVTSQFHNCIPYNDNKIPQLILRKCISPSDFLPSSTSNSSQSTGPIGRVLRVELLHLSRLQADEWIFLYPDKG